MHGIASWWSRSRRGQLCRRPQELRCRSDFADADQAVDGVKEADFPVGAVLGDCDDDGVLMDIQTDVACNSFHGVVVGSHSPDESTPA